MFLLVFQKLNLNQIYEDFNLFAFVGYYFPSRLSQKVYTHCNISHTTGKVSEVYIKQFIFESLNGKFHKLTEECSDKAMPLKAMHLKDD